MAKQLSGFQKRKLKQEREEAERRDLLGVPDDGDTGSGDFAELGKPDLNNPDTGLEFTRKYLLISLYQIGNDKGLVAKDRWRLIKDIGSAIGMTHPRASIESKFKKLREAQEEPAQEEKAVGSDAVPRPPTARQY